MDLYARVKQINEAEYAINRLIFKQYKKALASQLTTQQAVLLDIVYAAGKITVGELALEMDISSSAVSQLIAKLEKNGYVHRSVNPDNRREVFITLGPQGLEYFDKQEQVQRAVAERLYAKLTQAELGDLERITAKLMKIAQEEFR
ncbi:MarR family transcriptional regulator [Paenibacillus sp. alder61]|uniref:MarR family transcriptional regulator n=1 Tax=Paenibacillus faecis TaxID=862114 RepID=A0A5D0CL82_9BACL|nr:MULTISPECIES: MarR family transcriptional regulator [Paenibacillus]MCA1292859.1 MarR family transcriptional regulator [Paenibacillus sp. alder61]TYA10706.1 MarR family transcriptional regulator [Paenibacillus faecis]